jgi:hypothetical protein
MISLTKQWTGVVSPLVEVNLQGLEPSIALQPPQLVHQTTRGSITASLNLSYCLNYCDFNILNQYKMGGKGDMSASSSSSSSNTITLGRGLAIMIYGYNNSNNTIAMPIVAIERSITIGVEVDPEQSHMLLCRSHTTTKRRSLSNHWGLCNWQVWRHCAYRSIGQMLLSQTGSVVATRTKSLKYLVVVECAKSSNSCCWHVMWHRGAMIFLLEKYESLVYVMASPTH